MSSDVNDKVLTDEILNNKVIEEQKKMVHNYKKTLKYLAADAPIESLCLPSSLEKRLIGIGCFRIYDMLDRDFTKIKGFGPQRCALLTSTLDQFLSMSI